MTATRNLLDNLIEGRTYQVSTSADPSGKVRWHVFAYRPLGAEKARALALEPDFPMWDQIATRLTGQLGDGEWRAAALAWLAEVTGTAEDCVLILPDGNERIGPQ